MTVEALIREESSGVTRAPDQEEGKYCWEMWITGRKHRGLIRGLWRKAAPAWVTFQSEDSGQQHSEQQPGEPPFLFLLQQFYAVPVVHGTLSSLGPSHFTAASPVYFYRMKHPCILGEKWVIFRLTKAMDFPSHPGGHPTYLFLLTHSAFPIWVTIWQLPLTAPFTVSPGHCQHMKVK